MASEVTLNLRTSVPKPMIQRSGVKPAESLEANLVQIRDLITWLDTSASTSPLPSSWSSWQELRDASKFSDQVHVLDRILSDGWESKSQVWLVLGLFLTLPSSSHLLNRIRKQLTQRAEVDQLRRPLIDLLMVHIEKDESNLGPDLARCLESTPVTKEWILAASEQFTPLVLNQILSMDAVNLNQEPHFNSLIRALGQFSSVGDPKSPPKSILKALADLTRAIETSMDHKLNFCLPICRWMLSSHEVLNWKSMASDLELDHDSGAEVCFIQAFVVCCDIKLFREQGPNAWERIRQLTKANPTGPVLLQVSRFAVQFLKRIKTETSSLSDMEMDVEKCSSQMEDLIWILFESKIESVRHNTCNALTSLITILQHHEDQLNGILRRIVSMNSRSKIRCLALLQVVKASPWSQTLAKHLDASIQNEVISLFEDLHLKKYAIELYEALLISSHQNSSENAKQWREHWLPPLFQASHVPEIEHLVTKIWRLCPEYFDDVNSAHQPTDRDPKSQKIWLLVIKSKKSSNKAKYDDFLDLKAFAHSFFAFNDDVRLLAFESLLTSRKGAEPYTKRELDIILKQTKENMNLETNWAKERYLALNKKFFHRLSASWDPMIGQIGLEHLSEFVQNLRKIYFQSLFPEANPARRVMALESLQIIRGTLSMQFRPAENKSEGLILRQILGDSFESNKRLALNLLQDFDSEQLSLATAIQVDPIIDKCRVMRRSVNPAHSLESAYLMLLLLKQKGYKLHVGPSPEASQDEVIKETIRRLLEDLTDQLQVARTTLSQAAQKHPMFGVLLNFRMFFEFKLISKSKCFEDELEALFNAMTAIHAVILPVLESDAPEGVTFEADASNSDAQALLLCAWRTSKEISLLMASLGKIYLFNNNPNLVSRIFRFLCDSLSVLKHRGAFEQAHLAFATLCQALGGSKNLTSLVEIELENVLKAISKGESLCSTRRSAGLPFLILSLVTAQSREDRLGSLSSVMQTLLSNAEDSNIPVASRVNALHVLRALFRANAFGEDMSAFTEQGLITTIAGFNSNLWEIRNASTLMYSTLVTRIFGVKRDKDEFSQKNAITTRMFFQKHPKLFDVFQTMLQNLVECLKKSHGSTWPQESICVPILVLLAKLKSAPISTGVDQFPMADYLPILFQCVGSSIQRVRELSARCLNLFATTPGSHLKTNWLLDWLRSQNLGLNPTKPTNLLHGRLLIVEYFLQFNGSENVRDKAQFGRLWLEILWQRYDDFIRLLRHRSISLRCVVCRIFFHSLEHVEFDEPTRTRDMLLDLNNDLIQSLNENLNPQQNIAASHYQSLAVQLFAAIALRFEVNLGDMIQLFKLGSESSRISILSQLDKSKSQFVMSQFIAPMLDSLISSGSVILQQSSEFYECILSVINKGLTRVERENLGVLSSSHLNQLREFVNMSINSRKFLKMKEQNERRAEEDKSGRLMWFSPQLICLASNLISWNKINRHVFWDFLLDGTSQDCLDTNEKSALAIVQCLQYFHQQTQTPTLLDWQDSRLWYLVLTLSYHNIWNVRNAMCQLYLEMFPQESHSAPSQLGPNFIRSIPCSPGTIGGVLRFLQDLANDDFQEERDDLIFDQSGTHHWREIPLIRSDLKEACVNFIERSDLDLKALQCSVGLTKVFRSKADVLACLDERQK